MSFWDTIIKSISGENIQSTTPSNGSNSSETLRYAFVDVEVSVNDKKIHDIGALRWDNAIFHAANKHELTQFLNSVDFVCGHNIIHHDAKYLFGNESKYILVDTLYISPILFPERPYHHLLKDDKLLSDQINNPVNDCEKSRDLLMDEISRWNTLSQARQNIYKSLLNDIPEFKGFLRMINSSEEEEDHLTDIIRSEFKDKICGNTDLESIIKQNPCELAYALALIDTTDHHSITPSWVLHNYPNVENVIKMLRHTHCTQGCSYCNKNLNIHHNLKQFFGYEQFRTYEGEPLQESAVQAAVNGQSLLAIFPTGGGKSLTFQVPALMEGQSVHGLTVVISPLQSLMKDQVDNLADRGITDAVTINGMLDPINRSLAIQRVLNGDASLLYIAPEMLRSKTIEKILLARHVVRFVIDEAHCFSSWGQDFRVDYLYIGKFINEYQKKKQCDSPIPVSCFTATAKQKVIQDICDYFKNTLNINLEIFASTASRTNLRYSVIHTDTDDDKYTKLRSLVAETSCPTIVYVSRTKRTKEIAEKLTRDGFKALPFNGKMDADEKISNQEAFMTDQVRIIVATSAFGMGVDKKDVGLVIHFDISDSLENYVQEAGRAGRDPLLQAKCYVLYSDSDLDKHFVLLNQTKLSISEIQQVWKAVKEMTKQRTRAFCSALEIARKAGWDDSVYDIETRVRTALSALEQAGYIERGNNVPHVYATGITVHNIDEARKRLSESLLFENKEIENAVRIIKSLLSHKHIAKAQDPEAEARVDYLADILGINKGEVISAIERMRQEGILADTKDISAYLTDTGESENKSKRLLEKFTKLERFILNNIPDSTLRLTYKQLNDNAIKEGITTSTEKDIRTLLYFLTIKGYTKKNEDAVHNIEIVRMSNMDATLQRFEKRLEICSFAVEWLYNIVPPINNGEADQKGIQFSIIELYNDIKRKGQNLFGTLNNIQIEDVEEALLYLSKIGALKLEGGFLVLYNTMDIKRIKDNKQRYKQDDYKMLNEFYKQKIQQVHIVGEYANLMVRDYTAALRYVQDYFQMDYKRFISTYFKGERFHEIDRNVTPQLYEKILGQLSSTQNEIISDKDSRCIVVAAGPGSGKTRVLVHKLASILLLEDVKHEQLLMLTFSRASATEFKQRLIDLIGRAAHFVEIKTFHSYCFDLLGRIGNIEDIKDVVAQAAQMIKDGEVEPNRISKSVLVIDEAQDMSAEEYDLVHALMNANEDMRVIAVGDDDQNIFEFRGSDSKYLSQLLQVANSRFIEMTDNYRSCSHIVNFANSFVSKIESRMKNNPITSKKQEDGYVSVTRHVSQFMYEPLMRDILQNRSSKSTCILTQTNEEAVILVALLRKHGLNSKLIQSMDGFRFCNIAEVRFFLKYIESNTHSPLIAKEVWEAAKQKTFSLYESSTSTQFLKKCIHIFEETNKSLYLTDFKELIFESSVEDFCDFSDTDVVVSTIHKSKGREFDDVFLLISNQHHITNDTLRRYYVGLTRAKQRMFIHTNCSLFDNIPSEKKIEDHTLYDMPQEIVLQLSHKDVNLGFFKSHKQEILSLRAGNKLRVENSYLYPTDSNTAIGQFSQKMHGTLRTWEEKNYHVTDASIRFIVAWKPKDAAKDEKEHAVLLIDLTLKRQSDNAL